MKPHEYNPKATLISALVIGVLIIWSYNMKSPKLPNLHFTGKTMGTSYNIKIAQFNKRKEVAAELQLMIDATLDEVNKQMSTWDTDSEISRFNNSKSIEEMKISVGFIKVLNSAMRMHELSDGAFDPTIKPLVDAWGFGEKVMRKEPDATRIESLKNDYGFRKILISTNGISKLSPQLSINLSAIAKGYGVDQVYRLLEAKGYANIFVEIGGEVRVKGMPFDAPVWRVGIELPDADISFGEALFEGKILGLNKMAVASSGSYRNFREDEGGNKISHIIDPRSGYPVRNGLVSLTVLAETCIEADALATAIFVLGSDEGLALVNRLENTEVLLVKEKAGGGFNSEMSSGFKDYLYQKK